MWLGRGGGWAASHQFWPMPWDELMRESLVRGDEGGVSGSSYNSPRLGNLNYQKPTHTHANTQTSPSDDDTTPQIDSFRSESVQKGQRNGHDALAPKWVLTPVLPFSSLARHHMAFRSLHLSRLTRFEPVDAGLGTNRIVLRTLDATRPRRQSSSSLHPVSL